MNTGGIRIAPLLSDEDAGTQEQRGDQSTWLFLSLYLLLFAFFIVLNSYSSFDTSRRDAVISSVAAAFVSLPGGDAGRDEREAIGSEGQARRFQDDVTSIFATAVPLERIRLVQAGTRYDVDVPTEVFFEGDSVNVRPILPMLDRIVTTVSAAPPGIRYEVAVIGQISDMTDEPVTAEMTPQLARVGNVARTLISRGMPPQSVSIGLERGDATFIRFVFLAVDEETTTGFFQALRQDAP